MLALDKLLLPPSVCLCLSCSLGHCALKRLFVYQEQSILNFSGSYGANYTSK